MRFAFDLAAIPGRNQETLNFSEFPSHLLSCRSLNKSLPKMLRYVPEMLGFFLAINAGAINAVSLMQPMQVGVSHATGSISQLSIQLVRGGIHVTELMAVLVCFLTGAIASGIALGGGRFDPHKRYGLVLMVESSLIFASFLIFMLFHIPLVGLFPLAMACGMQNALFTSYYHAVIRTTHMTGVITDLGLAIGKGLRSGHWDKDNLSIYLALLSGFVIGGISGVIAWTQMGMLVLLGNAVYTLGMGTAYFGFRRSHFA